jgi:hypothetical protein
MQVGSNRLLLIQQKNIRQSFCIRGGHNSSGEGSWSYYWELIFVLLLRRKDWLAIFLLLRIERSWSTPTIYLLSFPGKRRFIWSFSEYDRMCWYKIRQGRVDSFEINWFVHVVFPRINGKRFIGILWSIGSYRERSNLPRCSDCSRRWLLRIRLPRSISLTVRRRYF